MPKEPKKKKKTMVSSWSTSGASASSSTVVRERHAPLGQVIQDDINRGKFATRKISGSAFSRSRGSDNADNDEEEEGMMLDEKTSRRILDIAHEQRQEMELLEMKRMTSDMLLSQAGGGGGGFKLKTKSERGTRRKEEDSSDDDDDNDNNEDDKEEEEEEMMVNHDTQSGYVSMGSAKAIGLTPEEEALLSNMMGRRGKNNQDDEDEEEVGGMTKSRNLADIIMAKIEEKEAMAHRRRAAATSYNNNNNNNNTDDDDDQDEVNTVMQLPPKVIQVYTDIGKLLTHYTSGKLPKAFKVLPSLHNWEEVLYLTKPDTWTPQAMYAATRIFASNLNPKMAQRFYNVILLDSVRADIHTNRKLNYHYYMSLKKAVYKPAAFFKGILLPLCSESAYCTLREAIIIASVLQKVSIPVHHSAVAIHKLATMSGTYNGATSIFMRTLLDKKYSLPAPVIDSLIAHYVRFMDNDNTEELPVLWHQALLVFVQRYKNDINITGKEQLRELMKIHYHPKITVEIRRELFGSAAWREERDGGSTNSTCVGGGVGINDDVMVM